VRGKRDMIYIANDVHHPLVVAETIISPLVGDINMVIIIWMMMTPIIF